MHWSDAVLCVFGAVKTQPTKQTCRPPRPSAVARSRLRLARSWWTWPTCTGTPDCQHALTPRSAPTHAMQSITGQARPGHKSMGPPASTAAGPSPPASPVTQPTTRSSAGGGGGCYHVCIHCGRRAAQGLYREYSRDNIRLMRCVSQSWRLWPWTDGSMDRSIPHPPRAPPPGTGGLRRRGGPAGGARAAAGAAGPGPAQARGLPPPALQPAPALRARLARGACRCTKRERGAFVSTPPHNSPARSHTQT